MDIVERSINKDSVIDSFIIPFDNYDFEYQFRYDGDFGAKIFKFLLTKEEHKPFSFPDIDKVFLTKFFANIYWKHLKNKHRDKIINRKVLS